MSKGGRAQQVESAFFRPRTSNRQRNPSRDRQGAEIFDNIFLKLPLPDGSRSNVDLIQHDLTTPKKVYNIDKWKYNAPTVLFLYLFGDCINDR